MPKPDSNDSKLGGLGFEFTLELTFGNALAMQILVFVGRVKRAWRVTEVKAGRWDCKVNGETIE